MTSRALRTFSTGLVVTVGVGTLMALGASPSRGAEAAASPAQTKAAGPPNIVLVLSDDQPKGTMAAMPGVLSRIRNMGVTFRNGVIPTSLCCPSRASLLTGNLAHSTGVYSNIPTEFGGWPAFRDDETQTLATELSEGGYRTGLFGKYMNGYNLYGWQADGESAIPPGWDEFVAMATPGDKDAAYYGYSLIGTEREGPFPETAEGYSTDVLRDRAVKFVESTPSNEPFFVMLSVFGPHAPFEAAPRHVGLWADRAITTPEGVNERDMTDKPTWLQDAPRLSEVMLERQQRRRMDTLRSVDDAVTALVEAVGDRASNTLFIYLSDNGLMQGIHRLLGKNMPYRASHEVPMFMRWDGVIEPGSVTDRVTPNVDVTATIAEAAGVSWPMDGRSALSTGRRGVVLEAVASTMRPAYCGWRSKRYLYARYSTGDERELYDYSTDPAELDNLAGKRKYRDIEARLDRKTERNCQPLPPDFRWN